MPYLYSPGQYAESVAQIRDDAFLHRRPLSHFEWALYLPLIMGDTYESALTRAQAGLTRSYGPRMQELAADVAAIGTAQDVAERLAEYVEAGVRHFVFGHIGPESVLPQAQLLIDEVAPMLRRGIRL